VAKKLPRAKILPIGQRLPFSPGTQKAHSKASAYGRTDLKVEISLYEITRQLNKLKSNGPTK
jgi:hypothetical protein